jgi:hypothetical protein
MGACVDRGVHETVMVGGSMKVSDLVLDDGEGECGERICPASGC